MFATTGILLLAVSVPGIAEEKGVEKKKPHVVFVTGDDEYRSEATMPMIAGILETRHNMKCTVCYAIDEKTGQKNPKYQKNIEGLEALKTADLAVFFMRFRQLPDDQLKMILDYVNSGRPIVGLRTSTHAFRYPDGPHTKWNDDFGISVFGQKWIRHHGHKSSTNVYVAVKDHPITRGVDPEFHCRSWLYHVVPLHGDCRSLLIGSALKDRNPGKDIFGIPSPVAWTKSYKGARVFYTSLGHPMDLDKESVRRLLINGIYWALGKEDKIPAKGTDVGISGNYATPLLERVEDN
jgi:type 1 glutamine amidotransferase